MSGKTYEEAEMARTGRPKAPLVLEPAEREGTAPLLTPLTSEARH